MSATSSIPAGNVPVRQVDADEKAVLILLFEIAIPGWSRS
jgi:hypothetical protein